MDIREETGSRALPNSTEAEISVLGAMLQDSTAVLRGIEITFYRTKGILYHKSGYLAYYVFIEDALHKLQHHLAHSLYRLKKNITGKSVGHKNVAGVIHNTVALDISNKINVFVFGKALI